MKHMGRVIVILLFPLGFTAGVLFFSAWNSFTGPAKKDTDFVTTCGELNNKPLSKININKLRGDCYIVNGNNGEGARTEACEQKHLDRLVEMKQACGDVPVEKLNDYPIMYDARKNYLPTDPYFSCIEKFTRKAKNGDLFIGDSGTFSIKQQDGRWSCRISTVNNKIYAVPYYPSG